MGKEYKFAPYGPFDIPLEGREIPRSLNKLWKDIEEKFSGLPESVGCYIVAAKDKPKSLPWYVGKTVRGGFSNEVFQPHKRLHYYDLLSNHNGAIELYLIARVTSKGKPRRKYTGSGNRQGRIDRLEEALIGSALLVNPKLLNLKGKGQIKVPGYMNDSGEERTTAAKSLAKLFAK